MSTTSPSITAGDVHVVAYGEDIYVYPAARKDEAAAAFMVAIGANMDAEMFTVTEKNWQTAAADPRLADAAIHDFRER